MGRDASTVHRRSKGSTAADQGWFFCKQPVAGWTTAKSGVRPSPDGAEFIIGPAHRVRPLAGPMAGSGRTQWLHPGYGPGTAATFAPLTFKERKSYGIDHF